MEIVYLKLEVTINFGFNLFDAVFPKDNIQRFWIQFIHLFLNETYNHSFGKKIKILHLNNSRMHIWMKDSSLWNGANKNKRLHTYEWIKKSTYAFTCTHPHGTVCVVGEPAICIFVYCGISYYLCSRQLYHLVLNGLEQRRWEVIWIGW